MPAYASLSAYYGDLHSHCHEVGYGYGTVEDAYANVRLQLDFASVTAHAHWPDMPINDPALAETVAYHESGFRRAAQHWNRLLEVTDRVNVPGQFVSFPSWEWHSLAYGDHNIYFNQGQGEILYEPDLPSLRRRLGKLAQQGIRTFLIPHHIGYRHGHRGINWTTYSPEYSPVVEMFSMHGQAECDDAPYPYLHTMGPRDEKSTVQYGLRAGHTFGVIGSTDHHSAFPGSYGYGRLGVWSRELTREAIWEAIAARRTYALTGDRIELAFSINDQPMGAIVPRAAVREVEISVGGGGALDYVDLIHNNQLLERWSVMPSPTSGNRQPVKVFVEVGWGERKALVNWEVDLEVVAGRLLGVEPRLRGPDIVAPQAEAPPTFRSSHWHRPAPTQVRFMTQTWGNPTIVTPATQGFCLEIEGDAQTRLRGRFNDQIVDLALDDLATGAHTGNLGGFLSPAFCFHRAVARSESTRQIQLTHRAETVGRDWYYVRVCQKNGQWAWSSPIWVEAITNQFE